jgi:predicted HicB family RNase H-like nuclease
MAEYRSCKVGTRCYRIDMSVRKISVALDEGTAKAASEAAARNGVSLSSWLNQAADRALRVEEGLRAVQAWEAENGPLTAAELAAADRFLAKKQRKRAS